MASSAPAASTGGTSRAAAGGLGFQPNGGSAGRAIRLPIGYVWFIIGGTVLLLVLAYALGFSAGGARTQAERAADLERRLAEAAPIEDPLRRGEKGESVGAGDPGGRQAAPAPNPAESGAGGKGTVAGKGAKANPTVTSTNAGDPRKPEWFYLVVAHPRVEQAPQLVEFLKASGLDACVVRDHNGVARKVIVLPGFASKSERSSPAFAQLWDRLQAVGLKWKGKAKGNSGFGDAYLELYRPSGGP